MTSATTPHDPLVKPLQKIDAAIRARELKSAALQLNTLVKKNPGDARIYLMGMRLAEAAGNAAGALESARRAVALAPQWPVAVAELAFLLGRQNQFKEAIEQATAAVALAPDDMRVLTRAIDIAHRSQHFSQALDWLRMATAIEPDNFQFKHLIARDYAALDQHAEAIAAYTPLVEANARDAAALMGRLKSAIALGDLAQATSDGDALVAIDPAQEEFAFWRDVAHGKTPATQPKGLVQGLHDGFAELYDQHMVRSLQYQLPKQVAERILALYPDKKLNVLDLGCGTGLLGVCLGRLDGYLIGVDYSTKMIEQAVRHNVYDRFHTVNLLDALRETPESLYEVIAACDVFIYVGDLSEAIPNAFRVLRPGGQFIFSCETATEDEGDMVLRPTMRYAHYAAHIDAQCKAAGFDNVTIEGTTLRLEGNEPVQGFIVTAHKPAA